jgi:hypothetical protein
MPGRRSGKVIFLNTSAGGAYKSRPASSSFGSSVAIRAFTVTTTKLKVNKM